MRKVLRWLGLSLGVLAVLFVVAGIAVYFLSNARINKVYEISNNKLKIDISGASVKRGRHLIKAVGKCGECHARDLGGEIMADDPMFGRLVAPNLTSGRGG